MALVGGAVPRQSRGSVLYLWCGGLGWGVRFALVCVAGESVSPKVFALCTNTGLVCEGCATLGAGADDVWVMCVVTAFNACGVVFGVGVLADIGLGLL